LLILLQQISKDTGEGKAVWESGWLLGAVFQSDLAETHGYWQ